LLVYDAPVTSKTTQPAPALGNRVRNAVFWRSGSQIVGQMVMWAATIIVVRLLDPKDYGLFAMTQVVLVAFNFLNGYSFATSLIQADTVTKERIAQVFGMLLLLNGALALLQALIAPLAASYYGQPMIADMLRVQCLLFVTTPFIALPSALLARGLDFQKQAWVNIGSALAGATTALTCAWANFGVWTLVIAPIVAFSTRAIGLTIAARLLVWPSFSFKGSGDIVRFGTALLLCQLFWIVQSQTDIFVAGRILDPHDLGLYSESLFLTLIFTGRFLPPLNEVAFPAYAQLVKSGQSVGPAFLATSRLIMLLAAPLYVGLSLTAAPLVETLFGPKWVEMIPIVSGLALAMPFMALQIMCSPATNALSRPRIYVHSSIAGAIIMPVSFLIGIQWGTMGLVNAWMIASPLLLIVTLWLTLPAVGATWSALAKNMIPVITATSTMAAAVMIASHFAGGLVPWKMLATLVVVGMTVYGVTLQSLWPQLVRELFNLLLRRGVSVAVPSDQASPKPGLAAD
jgi:O-antigen/teichoic acid export membrane protein